VTAATLARQAADRDAALAEGGPDLDAYDPPATRPAAEAAADTATATSRPAMQQPTGGKPRTDGKPRRRAATYEENLAMARRVHAGEPATKVAEDTGFAVSTVQATYRWAKRERLLDAEEASR
jgi:hypothetical protein